MNQQFLNSAEDCQWLREAHLKPSDLNNGNPIPNFKSFCLFGNEDSPEEIIIYAKEHPTISDEYASAHLCDNGRYSFTNPSN